MYLKYVRRTDCYDIILRKYITDEIEKTLIYYVNISIDKLCGKRRS